MFYALISLIWLCTAGLLAYSAVLWGKTYRITKDPTYAALSLVNAVLAVVILLVIWCFAYLT